MADGSIMFLDLATVTGWCEGVPGEKPISGSIRLGYEGCTPEEKGAALFNFLAPKLMGFRYRMLVFEAPLDPRRMGRKTNISTARTLMGLAYMAGSIASLTNTRYSEANVSEVRSFILQGSKPPKDEVKRQVMKMVKTLGHTFKDDNEADAIAGWYYAGSLVQPSAQIASKLTPLFKGDR